MQQPPGERPDAVEELEGVSGLGWIEGAGVEQEAEVAVDLERGAIGDAPMVERIAAGSTRAPLSSGAHVFNHPKLLGLFERLE